MGCTHLTFRHSLTQAWMQQRLLKGSWHCSQYLSAASSVSLPSRTLLRYHRQQRRLLGSTRLRMRTGNLVADLLSSLEDPGATERFLGCAHGFEHTKLHARFGSQEVVALPADGISHLLMHVVIKVLQRYSSPCL